MIDASDINWSQVVTFFTGGAGGVGMFYLAVKKSRLEKKAQNATEELTVEEQRRAIAKDATLAHEGVRDDLLAIIAAQNDRIDKLVSRVEVLEKTAARRDAELAHEREYSRELLDYGYRHKRPDSPPPPKRTPMPA